MIEDSVSYAKESKPDLLIRFTPEDTVLTEFKNVVTASIAAVEAGADIVSVADTTGYMMPHSNRSMYDFICRLKNEFDRRNLDPKIAVHCHNDRGLALANALEAFQAGAEIIDASVLGIGERAGIVDLASLLAGLSQGYDDQTKWGLEKIVPLYDLVSKYADFPVPVNFPVVGRNAFRHCAGVHTHASQINPLHYQSLDPVPFGRSMEISLDHMSGISSIRYALDKIRVEDIDNGLTEEVLNRVKLVGQSGRIVDLEEFSLIVEYVKQMEAENCH
jgi:2-isopropylmalate synthase